MHFFKIYVHGEYVIYEFRFRIVNGVIQNISYEIGVFVLRVLSTARPL